MIQHEWSQVKFDETWRMWRTHHVYPCVMYEMWVSILILVCTSSTANHCYCEYVQLVLLSLSRIKCKDTGYILYISIYNKHSSKGILLSMGGFKQVMEWTTPWHNEKSVGGTIRSPCIKNRKFLRKINLGELLVINMVMRWGCFFWIAVRKSQDLENPHLTFIKLPQGQQGPNLLIQRGLQSLVKPFHFYVPSQPRQKPRRRQRSSRIPLRFGLFPGKKSWSWKTRVVRI